MDYSSKTTAFSTIKNFIASVTATGLIPKWPNSSACKTKVSGHRRSRCFTLFKKFQ